MIFYSIIHLAGKGERYFSVLLLFSQIKWFLSKFKNWSRNWGCNEGTYLLRENVLALLFNKTLHTEIQLNIWAGFPQHRVETIILKFEVATWKSSSPEVFWSISTCGIWLKIEIDTLMKQVFSSIMASDSMLFLVLSVDLKENQWYHNFFHEILHKCK